jgi:hypothetical protein
MDLGEVVEINLTDFAFTTPSPQADIAIRLNCGRIHPSLKEEGKRSFSIVIYLFYKLYSLEDEFHKAIGILNFTIFPC